LNRSRTASTLAVADALEAGHVGAGRLAHEEAGAGEPDAHRVRFVGGDGHALLDQGLIEDGLDDVLGAAEGLEASGTIGYHAVDEELLVDVTPPARSNSVTKHG